MTPDELKKVRSCMKHEAQLIYWDSQFIIFLNQQSEHYSLSLTQKNRLNEIYRGLPNVKR